MDDDLKNDLRKQFDILPPELQQAISTVDLPGKIQQVVKNNDLLINQGGDLQLETYLVLLGLQPLDKYIDNIVKNVGLPRDRATLVAHNVDDLVFKNIKDTLMLLAETEKENTPAVVAAEKTPVTQANIPTQKEPIGIPITMPTKANVLSGIETPSTIKTNEQSISVSSLQSNQPKIEKTPDIIPKDMEIRPNMLPEIAPEIIIPIKKDMTPKNNPPVFNSEPKIEKTGNLIPNDMEVHKEIVPEIAPDMLPMQSNTQTEIKIPIKKIVPEIKPQTPIPQTPVENIAKINPTPSINQFDMLPQTKTLPTQFESTPQMAPTMSKNQFDMQPQVPPASNPYRETVPTIPAMQQKMTGEIIVPREKIIIGEKTKIPEKPVSSTDPYREPIA